MSVQKIGQHVVREEDNRLLRGKGRYVSDVKLHGETQAYVLRSPHAHAKITAIDTSHAKAAPGVLAVLTGADLAKRGLGTLRPFAPRKRSNGRRCFACPQPLLVKDRVRYVGDPVAFVVAETLNQAKDAAELIDVTYQRCRRSSRRKTRSCPARRRPRRESRQRGVLSRRRQQGRGRRRFRQGGASRQTQRTSSTASRPIRWSRAAASRNTTRSTSATLSAARSNRRTRAKAALAGQIFKLPHTRFRVICDNMGGGFGMKGGCYPEYAVALFAAPRSPAGRCAGRPSAAKA